MIGEKALVLLSGGQDSTTCLYWAKRNFKKVKTCSFRYGQKHIQEILQARKISQDAGCGLPREFNLGDTLGCNSSLTDHHIDHNVDHPMIPGLPASFTPGRNMLFLTIAASYAFATDTRHIVTGVCQTDYSGYPDCRREFIDSMQKTLSHAVDPKYTGHLDIAARDSDKHDDIFFQIHTPLMYIDKAQTWKMAKDLGNAYVTHATEDGTLTYKSVLDVIVEDTMTDYNGDTTKNEWGMGVDNNPATNLRVKGFYKAKEYGWI